MADYETRADDERCWSCRYFEGEPGVIHGLCKKRAQVATQKVDIRTHRTNWCEHYEGNFEMNRKVNIEEAQIMADAEKYGAAKEAQDEVNTVLTELNTMQKELAGFAQSLSNQLTNAALQNNNNLLLETKGMINVVSMILSKLDERVKQLSVIPTVRDS